jgi:hypothetical protein
MGMYAYLRRIAPSDVPRIRDDPRLLTAFLFGDAPGVTEERVPGLLGVFLRIMRIKVEVAAPAQPSKDPLWPPPGAGEMIALDKAWHGLHFLLTGTDDGGREPACFLLKGGEDLGDEDDDGFQARLLDAEQVRWFGEHLASLTAEELTRRFDPDRMTELRIYPDVIWKRPEEEDEPRGYLLAAFAELRAFITSAAARSDAVVVCIS